MAHARETSFLSDQQKREVRSILTIGCDRETAANYANCSLADIRRQMAIDTEFAADVRRAEAGSELMHMRNVHGAAQDAKNWRASVWWLERRAPERFGRRLADAISSKQLREFLRALVSIVNETVRAPDDRERLLARIEQSAGPYLEPNGDATASTDDLSVESESFDSSDGQGEFA